MSKMLLTIIKNLFSKPATRKYPFEKRDPFKGSRGKITFDQTKCDHCGDCQRLCPAGAIFVEEKAKQITYDPFRCIYCWVCAENCLQKAIKAEEGYKSPDYKKEKIVVKK
ncbi:MAG: 4Fe-4S dicluster domain-containing protein [Planctomycetes bacterium]|nr:4Fe-4S dicluster domain-containing protein [Planctomycetota bacterium]